MWTQEEGAVTLNGVGEWDLALVWWWNCQSSLSEPDVSRFLASHSKSWKSTLKSNLKVQVRPSGKDQWALNKIYSKVSVTAWCLLLWVQKEKPLGTESM